MYNMGKHFISLLLFCGFASNTIANDQAPTARWDRSDAVAAIQSANIGVAIREIGDVSSLADGATTLRKLRALETRDDLPLPVREAAIHQFTRSLAEVPRNAVAVEIIQHLQNYQARTLVPHEERDDVYVPLFNIRGLAAGVENGWQRTESAAEATKLLETNPAALTRAYAQSSGHPQRSGYLDALQHADINAVWSVQGVALEQLGEDPGLTPLVARTAVITIDAFAVQQLLINGRGAGLSSALAQLDTRLQLSETAELLAFAIQQAPATNATLAIAAWWPRLKHDPATRDLLIERLADPALGAAAALALAQSPDIQTIRALQLAAESDSDAAKRAQMALDLNRTRLAPGGRP